MQLERVRVGNPLGGDPQQCATGQGLTALLPVGGMVLVCTAGAHLLRLDRRPPHSGEPDPCESDRRESDPRESDPHETETLVDGR